LPFVPKKPPQNTPNHLPTNTFHRKNPVKLPFPSSPRTLRLRVRLPVRFRPTGLPTHRPTDPSTHWLTGLPSFRLRPSHDCIFTFFMLWPFCQICRNPANAPYDITHDFFQPQAPNPQPLTPIPPHFECTNRKIVSPPLHPPTHRLTFPSPNPRIPKRFFAPFRTAKTTYEKAPPRPPRS